jgi:hypothetical protein
VTNQERHPSPGYHAMPYGTVPPAPAQPASDQAAPKPAMTVTPLKIVVAGVLAILVIVAAIAGHAIASSSSIAVGDCVLTNPSVVTGWDIKKTSCGATNGTALEVQKVVSVQSGTDGQCEAGLTTFEDDPAGKTYCLTTDPFGG